MKHLKHLSTSAPAHIKKDEAKEKTSKLVKELARLQHKMYANGEKSLLIIMQGLDAAGKDGAITKVFGGVNPMGCQVKSFGVPTKEESVHDFLRRIHAQTPAKGMIKIFNRSHYEDLVMPLMSDTISSKDYDRRVEDIKAFEKLLTDNGTHIIKIYFHISAAAQKERLEERLVNKEKHRKHKDGDREKASKYEQYLDIYSKVLEDTNFGFAKWNIIPADDNWYKLLQVATLAVDELHDMRITRPALQTEMHLITPHLQDDAQTKGKKEKKDKKKSKDNKSEKNKTNHSDAPLSVSTSQPSLSVKKTHQLPKNTNTGLIKGAVITPKTSIIKKPTTPVTHKPATPVVTNKPTTNKKKPLVMKKKPTVIKQKPTVVTKTPTPVTKKPITPVVKKPATK